MVRRFFGAASSTCAGDSSGAAVAFFVARRFLGVVSSVFTEASSFEAVVFLAFFAVAFLGVAVSSVSTDVCAA